MPSIVKSSHYLRTDFKNYTLCQHPNPLFLDYILETKCTIIRAGVTFMYTKH